MERNESVRNDVATAIQVRLKNAGIPSDAVDVPLRCTGPPGGLRLDVEVRDAQALGVDPDAARAIDVISGFVTDYVWKKYGLVEVEPTRTTGDPGRPISRSWRFALRQPR